MGSDIDVEEILGRSVCLWVKSAADVRLRQRLASIYNGGEAGGRRGQRIRICKNSCDE
jgi:hypothetical protein